MSEIQRYRQGFGFFGPLEKCNDGPLMDADAAIARMEEMAHLVNEALSKAEAWHGYAEDWRDLFMDVKAMRDGWKETARIWMLVSLVEFAVLLAYIWESLK